MPEKPDGYDKYLRDKETRATTVDTVNAEDRNKEEVDAGENTDGPVSKTKSYGLAARLQTINFLEISARVLQEKSKT